METIGTNLEENLDRFREIFRADGTFRHRVFQCGMGVRCAVLYLDGMVSSTVINEDVIRPLIETGRPRGAEDPAICAAETVLWAGEVQKAQKIKELVSALLRGSAVLLFAGSGYALHIEAKGFRTRGIEEPQNESVLQGPREGFCEAAIQNLALIRRKLQTEDLCMEPMQVGRRSGTVLYICYLRSLASPEILKEVKRRIGAIDIDGVLDTNYISELIRDRGYSVFKTIGTTERPDVVAAKLLEGRVAIVADGTPVALTMPYLFAENFQTDEDYYLNFWVSSIGRFLRYVCFFLTVSVPAIYLALLTHHQRLLPTFLLLSSAGTRGGVPFSSLAECLLLILILEILKETGARMPQNLGHTLGIIGGLVVGEAAVEARLISASMLIVVAISGIAGLMIPRLRAAVFYVRLGLVLLAAWLGIAGCLVGITLVLIRIIGISSFGVPYLLPLGSPTVQGLKDTVVRLPWSVMRTRPTFNRDRVRQKERKDS